MLVAIVAQETKEGDAWPQAEPIHDIAHLGSVELFTPKPDKSLWYFRDLLGMEPVHEAASRSICVVMATTPPAR